MKLKYYLRGAGAGILVSTLILSIAFAFKKPALSDEEIISRAEKLGMVMEQVDDSNIGTTESEDKEDVSTDEAVDKENTIEEVEEKPDINKEPIVGENEDKTSNESADKVIEKISNESKKSENKKVVSYVAFTVSPGQSSNAVAENLFKAGLIDNSEKFNEYLNQTGVDNLIQPGTFYIGSDSEYDDIVALLVTKQQDRDTTPPKAE